MYYGIFLIKYNFVISNHSFQGAEAKSQVKITNNKESGINRNLKPDLGGLKYVPRNFFVAGKYLF